MSAFFPDTELTDEGITCIDCGTRFVRRGGYQGNYCPSHRPSGLDPETTVETNWENECPVCADTECGSCPRCTLSGNSDAEDIFDITGETDA